jgi:hypothetical protein
MFTDYHSNFFKVVPMSNHFASKICIFIFSPKTFVARAKYSDPLGLCVPWHNLLLIPRPVLLFLQTYLYIYLHYTAL